MTDFNRKPLMFARSLNECFKNTTDYACSIEGPNRSSIAAYILGVVIAVVSCIAFYYSI